MLLKSQLLIAYEVILVLDTHLKLQILYLLKTLQKRNRLSVLFITHNIASIQNYADRIIVLKEGWVIELGIMDKALLNPEHNYTKCLLKYIPLL